MNRAHFGRCGSGKTFGLQLAARRAVERSPWSVLVLDPQERPEWPAPGVWGGLSRARRVHTPEQAAAALVEGVRLVVHRCAGVDYTDTAPLAGLADQLAAVAIESPAPVVLVLPEAHWSLREGRAMPPHVGRILHQWRHVGALCWLDSQNPQEVKKEALRAVPELRWWAPGGWQDFAVMRTIGGPDAERIGRAFAVWYDREQAAGRDPRGFHLRLRVGAGALDASAYRDRLDGRVDRVRLA